MGMRYAHLTTEHLARHANPLAERLPMFSASSRYDLATLQPALTGGSALNH